MYSNSSQRKTAILPIRLKMSDIVKCDFCSEPISAEEQDLYSCYMCGYGKNSDDTIIKQNICDECTMKHECSRCSGQCCPKCAMITFNCCGDDVILCGSYCPTYENDDGEESCARNHITKILSCGHIGCNYYTEGCLTCKRNNDRKVTGSDYNGSKQVVMNTDVDEDEEIISDCYDSSDDEQYEEKGGHVLNHSSVKGDSCTNSIQLSPPQECIEIVDCDDSRIEDSEEEDDNEEEEDDDEEEDRISESEVIAVYAPKNNNSKGEFDYAKRKTNDEEALKHDKVLVEDIMDMVQSDSLKLHLLQWLNQPSKKRKFL